eukprot:TRINITY_DN16409_c0_g1_i2.p1 TRINITY_DN16409_c0_g1~~TRINITY_DN16409_c0_g1_i2.p1  ORF type:complete len:145 (-),score=27.59 TRINITY_DN16409_c0_g1_i2:159-593(-)
MLAKYIHQLADCPTQLTRGVERIGLIAKAGLLRLYTKAGFLVAGISPIVHGQDPWFECWLDLCRLRHSYLVADSFTDTKFAGNPCAVVFKADDEEWMRNVAIEMSLAETAFLVPREGALSCRGEDWDIRSVSYTHLTLPTKRIV